jgi:hypothetical protein
MPGRGRFVYAVAALLTAAAFHTCWRGTPLIWDGAYQLCWTLQEQHAYSYLTRFHSWLVWQPTVWLSHFTQNPTALMVTYGLPFVLAPVVGLLCSWWFVKRHAPHLIIWVIFGIAAAPLPGQIFIINDSIFQQHLFWPVFVGAFVPLTRGRWVAWWLLLIFQFSHPIGMPMLLGTAVACAILAWTDAQSRPLLMRRTLLFGSLGIAAALKIFLPRYLPALSNYNDTYAEQEFSLGNVLARWYDGVHGWPILGLIAIWAGALFLFLALRVNGLLRLFDARVMRRSGMLGDVDERDTASARRLFGILAITCIIFGGLMWSYWAADSHRWWKALDYRRWLVPLTFPFFLLTYAELLLDALPRRVIPRPAGGFPVISPAPGEVVTPLPALQVPDDAELPWLWRLRARASILLGLIFLLVLGIQGEVWASLYRRLERLVADHSGPLITEPEVAWAKGTPLEHWGMNAQIIYMQGPRVEKMLIEDQGWALMKQHPGTLPLCWFTTMPVQPQPGKGPWFDSRPFVKRLASTTRPAVAAPLLETSGASPHADP